MKKTYKQTDSKLEPVILAAVIVVMIFAIAGAIFMELFLKE